MSVLISADDARSIRALELAAGAGQWLKLRDVRGEVGFGVPSSHPDRVGRYYLVTATTCDCEDFKRTGLSFPRLGSIGEHGLCKHIRAVLLHLELCRAQSMPRRKAKRVPHPNLRPFVTTIAEARARRASKLSLEPAF